MEERNEHDLHVKGTVIWYSDDDDQPNITGGLGLKEIGRSSNAMLRVVRLTSGPLQATLSKLLTYCVLRPTQPPTVSGTGNE